MRRILFIITLLLFLVVVPSSSAQEPTDTPDPDALVTPRSEFQLVSLPFGDTFDSSNWWTADGAWQFTTDAAYEGAGWFLDGTQRDQISTLALSPLLDLSGALSAQLVYRQKGNLPTTDLISLDISFNDGLTWLTIDEQIGLDTDWDLHIVDLTEYRGLVIRLRFRVNAGLPIPVEDSLEDEDPVISGYWIDNLSIQYVLNDPTMAFVPYDDGPHTLLGLHLIVGAQEDPIVDIAKRLREIGWPLGTLKGTTGTEGVLNEVATVSPETVIIYRSLMTPWGMRDCPNDRNDPVAEAQLWMAGMIPYWNGVQADYYEITNECQPPMNWLVPFSIESMRIANEQGLCLLLFSFSGGRPEPYEYAQLLPVYEYALQNPCRSGRYHGVALHAYSGSKFGLLSESGIYLGLRHRLYYALILSQLPEAIQIPVYLTEVGPGDGRTPFKCEDVARDMIQYTQQLEKDPYIRGMNLWNFGLQGEWVDLTPCLPLISEWLVSYYGGR
jgi:hypothetical protein